MSHPSRQERRLVRQAVYEIRREEYRRCRKRGSTRAASAVFAFGYSLSPDWPWDKLVWLKVVDDFLERRRTRHMPAVGVIPEDAAVIILKVSQRTTKAAAEDLRRHVKEALGTERKVIIVAGEDFWPLEWWTDEQLQKVGLVRTEERE